MDGVLGTAHRPAASRAGAGGTGDQGRRLAAVLGVDVDLHDVGGESRAYRVGTDELVTLGEDWPEFPEPASDLERRVRLLDLVARHVDLPVPQAVRMLPEHGLVVVRRLPGVRMIDLPREQQVALVGTVAPAVGRLLAGLHAIAPDEHDGLVVRDDFSLEDWRDETAELADDLGDALALSDRRDVERFLAQPLPAPAATRRLSHNDLGIEHVLVSAGTPGARITGVIDWDDAAVTDPAYDFGLLLRDLGPAALDLALRTYEAAGGSPVGIPERARFYARCTLVEDLAFGLTEGRGEYVAKSRATWSRILGSA